MLYALICTDKAGALQTRLDNRDAHLAYIKETGVVAQAGPFLNEAGEMSGSLVIVDVAERADAQSWAENDPYAKAGLFSAVRIEAWKRVVG
ncbi:YciI family protein [Celeribacter arenosi]|uniref:YciI family protein n=1 Tax=Celeribacter arenosi TaxID=792649 RepID=A0ABP7JZ63_9RHOB